MENGNVLLRPTVFLNEESSAINIQLWSFEGPSSLNSRSPSTPELIPSALDRVRLYGPRQMVKSWILVIWVWKKNPPKKHTSPACRCQVGGGFHPARSHLTKAVPRRLERKCTTKWMCWLSLLSTSAPQWAAARRSERLFALDRFFLGAGGGRRPER